MNDRTHSPTSAPGQKVRWLRNGAGILLLLAGLGGLFLPILQALLMIAAGLWLVDLPIKRRAHRVLMGFGWYRRLAAGAQDFAKRWQQQPPPEPPA